MHFSIDRTVHTTAFDKPVVQRYKDSEDVKLFCGMMDSLALLPIDDLPAGLEFLRNNTPEGMEPLLNYFDATYCTGTYCTGTYCTGTYNAARGEPPRKRVKRVYTQLQSRLHRLCVDRRDGNKTVEEFLRGAGHNIRWKPHGNQNQVVE